MLFSLGLVLNECKTKVKSLGIFISSRAFTDDSTIESTLMQQIWIDANNEKGYNILMNNAPIHRR